MALSIDDLRSFLLVASERSVTRAALKVGVSQQSVSERIRRLERRVGVKLFSRTAYGMQPTTAGFRLLPYATQCVALVDQALAVVDDDDLVRVRIQRSVRGAVLPLLEGFPGGRMETSVGEDAPSALAGLADGSIDVALGVFTQSDALATEVAASSSGRAAVNGNGEGSDGAEAQGDAEADVSLGAEPPDSPASITIEALFTDPVLWVAPPEHPLATRRSPVSLAELGGFPMGLVSSGTNGAAHTGPATEAADEANGPDGGDQGGLRVAARSAVAAELASGELVEIPVDQTGWVVPISIAFRGSDHDRPAIVALRDSLVEGHARASSPEAPSRATPSPGARR